MATTDISIKIARLQTTLEADTQKITDTANRMSDIANQIAELTKTNERLKQEHINLQNSAIRQNTLLVKYRKREVRYIQDHKKQAYRARCIEYLVRDIDNEAQEMDIRERWKGMLTDEIISEVHRQHFENLVGCKYEELEILDDDAPDIRLLPGGYEDDCLGRRQDDDSEAFDCCSKRFAWNYIDIPREKIGLYNECDLSFSLDTTLSDITHGGCYVN
jgi:hypothetical protein